jgi:MoaA/NifB/PqqE/SkfB family radical SAM enzyme
MRHQGELHRIIIEVTNRCNLDCSICLRQSWNGKLGDMSAAVYSKLVSDLQEFPSPPDIFSGGYGEPLSHPQILDMLQQATSAGCLTSLITNGTFLTSKLVGSLVESGVKQLWISIDSSHQETLLQYTAGLSVMELLGELLGSTNGLLKKLNPGLAIVLTKINRADISNLIDQGLDM